MKKSPHVIWLLEDSRSFFRKGGEIRVRPSSVLPGLIKKGFSLGVLLPYDSTLLPKTKLSPDRISPLSLPFSKKIPFKIIKLSKGNVNPGIFMTQWDPQYDKWAGALFSYAGICLSKKLKKPVDVFHLMGWKAGLLPYYIRNIDNLPAAVSLSKCLFGLQDFEEDNQFDSELALQIGISKTWLGPGGFEKEGHTSLLKAGMIFSDGISLMSKGKKSLLKSKEAIKWQGILKSQFEKVFIWSSNRSVQAYLKAYKELMGRSSKIIPKPSMDHEGFEEKEYAGSLVSNSTSREKIKGAKKSTSPLLMESVLQFLAQSPWKAYVYGEWRGTKYSKLELLLKEEGVKENGFVGRGISDSFEFWLDVKPNRLYRVQLVGRDAKGRKKILLNSNLVRTPQHKVSQSKNFVFLDTRTGKKVHIEGVVPLFQSAPNIFQATSQGERPSSSSWVKPLDKTEK